MMEIVKPEAFADAGMIFDSHAHYDDARFDGCREELLNMLPSMGVGAVVNCAVDDRSAEAVLKIAQRFPFCYAAVGYHPENLAGTVQDLNSLEKFLSRDKVVAVGEIGLDYYWDKENAETQKKWMRAQIELAKSNHLPIIVHDREAHADTLEILQATRPQGVIHCFSGSVETAKEILKIGMYIGIGGVLTFKNSKLCKQVAEMVPHDRLLLETDAPYLAPEPYRGKLCHSGMIIRVAERVAEIWGVSTEQVLKTTADNAKKLFNI